MTKNVLFEKIDGNRGVRIIRETDRWVYLSVTTNGWQWTSVNIDDVVGRMIIDGLEESFIAS